MFKAIGVIELKSIPKGVEATDAALKSAGVEMVAAHPACPGKYEIILTGSISPIKSKILGETAKNCCLPRFICKNCTRLVKNAYFIKICCNLRGVVL